MNRIRKTSYIAAVRIAKAERTVVIRAMRLHEYNPPHSDTDLYLSHVAYLRRLLRNACDALARARSWHAKAKAKSRTASTRGVK